MKICLYTLIAFNLFLSSCGLLKRPAITQAPPPPPTVAREHKPVKTIENAIVSRNTASSYVEQYKDAAIREMNSYGIPASITLAQGILESASGNSSLAREANNHFGIKCSPDWKGKTILRDDDHKDDCFRVYSSVEESFRDHSKFLLRKRYAALFELDKNDYKGWAHGLKEAGYATNPRYAELLISLIERYDLTQYDRKEGRIEKIQREDKVLTEIVQNIPQEAKKDNHQAPVSMVIYEVKAGDTLSAIAKRFGLTLQELMIINDLKDTEAKYGQLLLVSK